jgi:hypothetical protein
MRSGGPSPRPARAHRGRARAVALRGSSRKGPPAGGPFLASARGAHLIESTAPVVEEPIDVAGGMFAYPDRPGPALAGAVGETPTNGRDIDDVMAETVSAWDMPLVATLGLIAGALTAGVSLRRIRVPTPACRPLHMQVQGASSAATSALSGRPHPEDRRSCTYMPECYVDPRGRKAPRTRARKWSPPWTPCRTGHRHRQRPRQPAPGRADCHGLVSRCGAHRGGLGPSRSVARDPRPCQRPF